MQRQKDSFEKNVDVPFFIPWITENDKKDVLKALDSSLLTLGPKLEEFENKFAKFTNSKYAIGVSNASTALQLAVKVLGIKKMDQVILPDFTFVSTASAVINNNAIPVLADVDINSFNISIESIKKKINRKTKAIIPVHFAGKSCNMKEIIKIAKKNDLFVIEDCAHAIGTKFLRKHVGTFGDIGCFSFYPTKNITTAEGGMLITNSKKIADELRSLRNHGMTKSLSQRYGKGKPWEYDVKTLGFNFRLDEIRSTLGISQLKRVKNLNNLRKIACKYYNQQLKGIKGITTPKITNEDSCHLYIIKIEDEYPLKRDELYKKMLLQGIRTTVHYKPLHEFSVLKEFGIERELKKSSELYNKVLSLPLFPQISRREQNKVINCIINNKF